MTNCSVGGHIRFRKLPSLHSLCVLAERGDDVRPAAGVLSDVGGDCSASFVVSSFINCNTLRRCAPIFIIRRNGYTVALNTFVAYRKK
jgi:hypothetical protein